MNHEELLNAIVEYFRFNIFERHLNKMDNSYAQLSSYSINPFITPYLSRIITGNYDARGIASALYFSRVLSTSITTTFGTHIKNILVNNGLADSLNDRSNIISFTDRTTDRNTVCLLKSGPNTINAGDIQVIRAKLNYYEGYDTRAMGIIYGNLSDLNAHYLDLQTNYRIFVGSDFWHRITGQLNFYNEITERTREVIMNLNIANRFQAGLASLEADIEASHLFGF